MWFDGDVRVRDGAMMMFLKGLGGWFDVVCLIGVVDVFVVVVVVVVVVG